MVGLAVALPPVLVVWLVVGLEVVLVFVEFFTTVVSIELVEFVLFVGVLLELAVEEALGLELEGLVVLEGVEELVLELYGLPLEGVFEFALGLLLL